MTTLDRFVRAKKGQYAQALNERLIECLETMLDLARQSAKAILGDIDAQNFRSCLMLFEAVAAVDKRRVSAQALERFCAGQRDATTLELL